jgi:hypothetical protein
VLELNISVRKTWNFVNLGKDTAFNLQLSVPQADLTSFQIPLNPFVESLARRSPKMPPFVLPGRGEGSAVIDNLRGRPLESFGTAEFGDQSASEDHREEELIFIAGTVLEPPDKSTVLGEGCPEEPQEPQKVPFNYRVATRFHSFTKRGHIRHTLSVSASSNIKNAVLDFQLSAISCLSPAAIGQVRFGFESYQTHFLGSMFGTIPSIEGRFYFAATASQISVFLEEAGMRKKGQLPLEESGMIAALDSACTDTGLYTGLADALRAKL